MEFTRGEVLSMYRSKRVDRVINGNEIYDVVLFPGERYFGGAVGPDSYGVYWQNASSGSIGGGCTIAPGYPPVIKSIIDWEKQVKFPDFCLSKLEELFRGITPASERKRALTGMFLSGLFERFHHLIGFEEAFIAMYEEPNAVQDFLNALTEYRVEAIDYLIDFADPDIIQIQDDWGMQDSMLMSPDMWREFIKPHIKRLVDHIHKRGKIYEQHSCGYIEPIVGDLVELGVDALNPVMVSNDITLLLERYGDRIVLLGGLDNQLIERPNVTEQEIREEVRRAIDMYLPLGCYVPFLTGVSMKDKREIVMDEIFHQQVNRKDK